MCRPHKSVIILSTLFLFYIIGSLIFTKGFLLKRVVVSKNSSCHVDFAEYTADGHGDEGCWLHRRFNKAIILIIDALRFDFMAQSSDPLSNSVPYLNKMPNLMSLVESQSKNSRLYKFIADPPTTTLQRLKGLTTGSLPTFVDAGSNFASSEITEDNFIDQLARKGKRLIFMGDDTWTSLFPGRFIREFSFPSFNVKDLHTVDDGILKNLYKETQKKDWDLIIAHFLGVDHCGHTYGPNHLAMTEKLSQMDRVIRNITGQLDKDTILFVMGDHGMTVTGDHGGDSEEELSAGLFVYSPSQITASQYVKDEYKTVSQTDFVPTISLLLGIPVPFSNLGTIITDLFNYCDWSKDSHIKEVYHTVQALRLNAQQMSNFVDAYMEVSSDLAEQRYTRLREELWDTEQQLSNLVTEMFIKGDAENAHGKLHSYADTYMRFTQEVRSMCQDVWAKFDLTTISLGINVLLVTLALNVYMLLVSVSHDSKDGTGFYICMVMTAVFVIYSAIQTFFMDGQLTHILAFILGGINLFILAIAIKRKVYPEDKHKSNTLRVSFPQMFALVVIIMSTLVFFSNSFVVYEDRISAFLAQSSLAVFCVYSIMYSLKKRPAKTQKSKTLDSHFDIMKILTQPVMLVIYLFFLCSTCLRVSASFRACREEQINCTTSYFLQPLSSLGNTVEGSKNFRYFSSAACLILLMLVVKGWLKHFGNLNGNSFPVLFARYFLPVSVVCAILNWAVLALPEKVLNTLPVWQQALFAQLVYAILILALLAILISPLCVYVIPKKQDYLSLMRGSQADMVIKQVYNHIKLNWTGTSGSERKDQPPVVYGLGTVFTSTIIYIGCILYILVALLLGDRLSPSLLLSLLTLYTFLELYTVTIETTQLEKDFFGLAVVVISLFSTNFFYATGHHATIPSIRFEAAFIGFHGNWDNKILPALLIHLNTFAAEVIFTWLSPLLILWPSVNGLISKHIVRKKENELQMKGDFVFYENQDLLNSRINWLLLSMYLFSGIKEQYQSVKQFGLGSGLIELLVLYWSKLFVKIFGSMVAAMIHRRHLFVWKIFAPRFVFQAMSSFTMMAVSILSLLIIIRIQSALKKLITELSKKV